MDDTQPKKGSYARRRTEIKRDEMRETIKLNRIEAHERAALAETLKACERFYNDRGLSENTLTNDFRKVVVTVVNIEKKPEEKPKFTKHPQPPSPAKSLKAALIRETVMAARRAGLIRDGYQPEISMPMVEWRIDE